MNINCSIIVDFKKNKSLDNLNKIKDSIYEIFLNSHHPFLPTHLTLIKWSASKKNIEPNLFKINPDFNRIIKTTSLTLSKNKKHLWFEVKNEMRIKKIVEKYYANLYLFDIKAADIFKTEVYHISLVSNVNIHSKIKGLLKWLEESNSEILRNGLSLKPNSLLYCEKHKTKGWFVQHKIQQL
ncbi:MAG: hypothetical protein AB1432_16315 [Bacteroidota bacterium]|jgi:hypothetical protein